MNAENNWWGCNDGPGNSGCDVVSGTGSVAFDPWLVLGTSASPNPVATGSDSTITADLTKNSTGTDTSDSGTIPNGTPVTFATDLGSVSPTNAETADGKATTTFTADANPGTANVSATVDQQSVSAPVSVEGQEPPDDQIQCTSKPCYGTNQADTILERVGNGLNDEIRARAAGDEVRANKYKNVRDLVYGSDGDDTLRVDDGDTKDEVRGQGGIDTCIVDARREAISGCKRIIVR